MNWNWQFHNCTKSELKLYIIGFDFGSIILKIAIAGSKPPINIYVCIYIHTPVNICVYIYTHTLIFNGRDLIFWKIGGHISKIYYYWNRRFYRSETGTTDSMILFNFKKKGRGDLTVEI